jgi:hypothetical protein
LWSKEKEFRDPLWLICGQPSKLKSFGTLKCAQHSMHLTPDPVRRGRDGGTAARRDCVGVFRQFA